MLGVSLGAAEALAACAASPAAVEVPPAAARSISVQVRVPPESGKKGSNQIYFDVKSITDERVAVHEKATFLNP